MKFNIFNFISLAYARISYQWSKVRKKHLQKQPICAACGNDKKLEVHHIKPVHKYPELELEPENLITLCADPCHLIFGHLKHWKSWNENVVTDCEEYLQKIKERP